MSKIDGKTTAMIRKINEGTWSHQASVDQILGRLLALYMAHADLTPEFFERAIWHAAMY